MNKRLMLFLLLASRMAAALSQTIGNSGVSGTGFPDSVKIIIHPSHNRVDGFHKLLFGENFRKEWAIEVKLLLIKVSKMYDGLTPLQYGGMQTKSIRMKDGSGKEWVLRSVEKVPDKLVRLGTSLYSSDPARSWG